MRKKNSLATQATCYLLFALLPSRVAHKLRSAELCSSREFGFSTRILLMSSTLSCNSRANSRNVSKLILLKAQLIYTICHATKQPLSLMTSDWIWPTTK